LIVTGLILIGAIGLDALQQKRRSSAARSVSDQK
jgi:hypothetical protein